MSLKRFVKRRRLLPPTKQQLYDALVGARDAFEEAADMCISNPTAPNQLAVLVTLRALSTAERAWEEWIFNNTP